MPKFHVLKVFIPKLQHLDAGLCFPHVKQYLVMPNATIKLRVSTRISSELCGKPILPLYGKHRTNVPCPTPHTRTRHVITQSSLGPYLQGADI